MYNIRNPQHEGAVYTIPGDMCYENKLMVGSTPKAHHQSEMVYLNVCDPESSCTRNEKRWYRKYAIWGRTIDVLLAIIILAFTAVVEFGYIPHVHMGFYCGDPSLSHRFTGDTITSTILAVVTFFGPLPIMYMVESNRGDGGIPLRQMWIWFRGYLVCLLSFLVLCQTLKVTTGEHRPHFLHTCAPDTMETCSSGSYITEFRCLNTGGFKGYIVPDSSLSFPSGHAGLATITSFFCAALIHVRFEPHHIGVMIKPVLSTGVLMWAFVVAISRLLDHRHHWWDVLVGTLLGLAFVTYSIIYHCDSFKIVSKEANVANSPFKTTVHGSGGSVSSKDCCPIKHHVSTTSLIDANNKGAASVII